MTEISLKFALSVNGLSRRESFADTDAIGAGSSLSTKLVKVVGRDFKNEGSNRLARERRMAFRTGGPSLTEVVEVEAKLMDMLSSVLSSSHSLSEPQVEGGRTIETSFMTLTSSLGSPWPS